jgi:3-hydroxyisobutyrate dehydrogenase-like beta-hydroxyacid dehydrogenase
MRGLRPQVRPGCRIGVRFEVVTAQASAPAARGNAYPTPLASASEQLYLAGRRAGLGRADDSSVIQILRGIASAST